MGQFLDHDLTRDETRLEHASAAPERTKNFHAPRLNLESVYGGGPKKSPELYDLSESGSETFLLGDTKAMPQKKIPPTLDDFFRRDGRPLLAVNLSVGVLTLRPVRFSRKLERIPCEN